MPRRERRVAVIGAGVNGLTCGIVLRQRGWIVTILSDRRPSETTSARAGAVFTPFRMAGDERAARWTERAHAAFSVLAADPGVSGVDLAPARLFFHTPQSLRPWWAEALTDLRQLSDPPAPFTVAFSVRLPRMDMTRYLPWLERRFVEHLGGTIAPVALTRLDEPFERGFDAVVNCSGLGARDLVPDPAVMSMRGQVLHVSNPGGLNECLIAESSGEETTYLFPFPTHVVLGGTYERGASSEETDERSLRAILKRCRRLMSACGYDALDLDRAAVLRRLAGLRPARVIGDCDEAVRLERQDLGPGRCVVHNYGHGRAGVTLSWACAEDVGELLDEALPP